MPIRQIIARGKLQPGELYRIESVMQGLLALRQVLEVQRDSTREDQERASLVREHLLALATEVIERIHCQVRCEHQRDVEGIIDAYCDALDAALQLLDFTDPELEPHFRVALRWTTS